MTATTLKIISILAYLFIMLMGTMIGIPFIVWLLFTAFDFGNTDQIFAVLGILGILGILVNLVKWKNSVPPAIVSFLMMLSPLISRTIQVPFELFNYLLFQIPLAIFIIGYPASVILTVKKQNEMTA